MHRATIDKTILNSLEKLSPVDKLKLVDFLLLSIDKPNPKIAKAWEEEVEDRLKAFERGESRAEPYEIFMKRFSQA